MAAQSINLLGSLQQKPKKLEIVKKGREMFFTQMLKFRLLPEKFFVVYGLHLVTYDLYST